MSTPPPIKNSSQSMLDIKPFQQMIVELDEKAEETLSAGTIEHSGIKYSYIVRWNVSNSTQRS
jgi:hypothetical protein